MSEVCENFRKSSRRSRGLLLKDRSLSQSQRKVLKTPYSTISSRKILKRVEHSATDKKREVVGFEQIEAVCKDFVGKTWTCYSCSPLISFKTEASYLRRCSTLLSAFISSELRKKAEFSSSDSSEVLATFSIVKGIAFRKDEHNAVKITLRNSEKKVTSEVYLCSVDVSRSEYGYKFIPGQFQGGENRNAKSVRVLPLVLCTGRKRQSDVTLTWLQKCFNCTISKMKFDTVELQWMISMWCGLGSPKAEKAPEAHVGFTWRVSDNGLDTIQAQIDVVAARSIWDCLTEGVRNEVTVEVVDQFMSTIHRHFFQPTRICFDAFPLVEIFCPIVWVDSSGRIKISSAQYAMTVLAHLSCLAMEEQSKDEEKEGQYPET